MRKKTPSGKEVLNQSNHLQNVVKKAQYLVKMRALISELLPLELQSQCSVANYHNGILVMHTQSSIWGTRLRLLLPALLKRLKLVDAFAALHKIEVKVRPNTDRVQATLAKATLSDYGKATIDELKRTLKD